MASCLTLTIINYKLKLKGKIQKSRESSSALPYTSVLYLLKREPSCLPRLMSPTLIIYIYMYIDIDMKVNKYLLPLGLPCYHFFYTHIYIYIYIYTKYLERNSLLIYVSLELTDKDNIVIFFFSDIYKGNVFSTKCTQELSKRLLIPRAVN